MKKIKMKNKDKLKVMFVCRGSVRDGLGHITRSRTLAKVMDTMAWSKFAVIGDSCPDKLLKNRGLDYVIVKSESQIITIYQEFKPEIVIFDLLEFNSSAFSLIKNSSITVSLSPIFNHLLEVDLIFHRSAIQGEQWRTDFDHPLIKSGLDYAIINEHCQRIETHIYRHNIEQEILSVAISMGGADAANKTLKIIDAIKHIPQKMLFWVMLGEGYAHSYQELVDIMSGSQHEIILAKSNDSMWRILNSCCLTILAGGTTTYEAAYAGLPSINILEQENHFFLIKELIDKGICLCAGTDFDYSLSTLDNLLISFNQNRYELLRMHGKSKVVIDGWGAKRIAGEIYDYYWHINSKKIVA